MCHEHQSTTSCASSPLGHLKGAEACRSSYKRTNTDAEASTKVQILTQKARQSVATRLLDGLDSRRPRAPLRHTRRESLLPSPFHRRFTFASRRVDILHACVHSFCHKDHESKLLKCQIGRQHIFQVTRDLLSLYRVATDASSSVIVGRWLGRSHMCDIYLRSLHPILSNTCRLHWGLLDVGQHRSSHVVLLREGERVSRQYRDQSQIQIVESSIKIVEFSTKFVEEHGKRVPGKSKKLCVLLHSFLCPFLIILEGCFVLLLFEIVGC